VNGFQYQAVVKCCIFDDFYPFGYKNSPEIGAAGESLLADFRNGVRQDHGGKTAAVLEAFPANGGDGLTVHFGRDLQLSIPIIQTFIEGQDTVKVFGYDADTGDGIYTAGGPNLETELIALAGGDNVMKGLDKAWTGVSLEEILESQPDVIVVHDYDTPTADEKIAAIKADPVLSQLQCVKDERFVVLPLEDAFPGSRTADAVGTLAEGFFPDCFK
jgi:hypothetical protein